MGVDFCEIYDLTEERSNSINIKNEKNTKVHLIFYPKKNSNGKKLELTLKPYGRHTIYSSAWDYSKVEIIRYK
jgi:hypothetical protein